MFFYASVSEPGKTFDRLPAFIFHSNPYKKDTEGTPWIDVVEPEVGYALYHGDNKTAGCLPLDARGNRKLVKWRGRWHCEDHVDSMEGHTHCMFWRRRYPARRWYRLCASHAEKWRNRGGYWVRGVSTLLCKRPGFVFGDGCAREGVASLPSPSDVEGSAFMTRLSPVPAFVPATKS